MVIWHFFIILLSLWGEISESAILRVYPNLEELFINERNLYASSSTAPIDPFLSYNRNQRKAACQQLLEARTYYILPEGQTEFSDSQTTNIPYNGPNFQDLDIDDVHLDYNMISIWLNESEQFIHAFICSKKEDGSTWYMTYGYNLAQIIVLQSLPNFPLPFVLGDLEKTPFINRSLYNIQYNLESRFLTRILKRETNYNSEICSLDMFRQFYLCTSVFDAWFAITNSTRAKEFHVAAQNNQCIRQAVKLDHKQTSKESPVAEISVDMLPCAPIHLDWHSPKFYVVPDPAEKFAVFLVVKTSNEYKIKAHVTEIQSLYLTH